MTDVRGTELEAKAPRRRIARDLEFHAVKRLLEDLGIYLQPGMGLEEMYTAETIFKREDLN